MHAKYCHENNCWKAFVFSVGICVKTRWASQNVGFSSTSGSTLRIEARLD
jgi:hypothetical protein